MAWWDASPEGRAWLRDRDAWLKRKRDDCDGDPKQPGKNKRNDRCFAKVPVVGRGRAGRKTCKRMRCH